MLIPDDWRERPAVRAALEALLVGARRALSAASGAPAQAAKEEFRPGGQKVP